MDIARDGATLLLSGNYDARSTGEVRTAVYDHLETHDHVVVDLTGVEVVDLTALRVLAVASRYAARDGRRLTLRGCNGAIRRLLHKSHLIRVVALDREMATA